MADYKTTIKIEGDEKGATGAISRVAGALGTIGATALRVSRTIGRALAVFSRLSWIVQSVQLVIDGFKKLHDWLNRAEIAARKLADRLERDAIATSAEHAAAAYKKLNKELEEANRLERERNSILERRQATERDLEDASAERDKELEIAKLDPASATYAEDRAAIERKYARVAADTSAARATEDARSKAAVLYEEAAGKDRAAADMQSLYRQQTATEERARERSFRLAMEARGGDPEKVAAAEKADEEWKKLFDAAKATKEAMEALSKEADSLRRQAGELAGGGTAAGMRAEAARTRIDNEERRSAAEREARDKAAAEREAERTAEAERRAAERREKEERQTRITELTERGRRIDDLTAGVLSVGPSQNRLTAMGLGAGSGVDRVQEQQAKLLGDLVRIGQQQIQELKDIKNTPSVAILGD